MIDKRLVFSCRTESPSEPTFFVFRVVVPGFLAHSMEKLREQAKTATIDVSLKSA